MKATTNINQWSAHDIDVLKPHKCISGTNISNLYGKYCDFIYKVNYCIVYLTVLSQWLKGIRFLGHPGLPIIYRMNNYLHYLEGYLQNILMN